MTNDTTIGSRRRYPAETSASPACPRPSVMVAMSTATSRTKTTASTERRANVPIPMYPPTAIRADRPIEPKDQCRCVRVEEDEPDAVENGGGHGEDHPLSRRVFKSEVAPMPRIWVLRRSQSHQTPERGSFAVHQVRIDATRHPRRRTFRHSLTLQLAAAKCYGPNGPTRPVSTA